MQRVDDVAEAEYRKQVAKTVFRHARPDHHQEVARMTAQGGKGGGRHWGFAPGGVGEYRGLLDLRPDVKADQDEDQADEERDPPAPAQQILLRHHRHQGKDAGGQQIADRDAHRSEAAEEAAPPLRRVFDRQDDGTAIFGAGAETLQQAHHDQQHGRPIADLVVGRQQPDQECAASDQQDGRDQHRLSPQPIAEMAEQKTAERPCDEADAKRRKRGERTDAGVEFRKEQVAENQGRGGAVDEEVIPFERRADGGGEHDAGERGGRDASWQAG